MSTEKCDILYVVNDPDFFISHRIVLAHAARNQGYSVHVATGMGPGIEKIQNAGFPFHSLPISRSGKNIVAEILLMIRIYRLYRQVKPALVHHVTIKPVLYGSIAARLAGIKAVVNAISGLGYVFSNPSLFARLLRIPVGILYRIAFGHANTTVIVQNRSDLELVTRSKWIAADHVELIKGSGADLNQFQPVMVNNTIPLVILASRMLWDKGVGTFVEAACLLKSEGLHARFVIVGAPDTGNPKSIPEETLRGWHKTGDVEWWGKRDDMPDVLANADIVSLPTYYGEGVPKVLIEAAAAGRPIVASDIPGCREIVTDGDNGLLVPARNSQLLADALRSLITNRVLRDRMGASGRKKAENEFSVNMVVDATMSIYKNLLS